MVAMAFLLLASGTIFIPSSHARTRLPLLVVRQGRTRERKGPAFERMRTKREDSASASGKMSVFSSHAADSGLDFFSRTNYISLSKCELPLVLR